VGHVDRAPILFVSSNPGADDQGALPRSDRSLSNESSDEELIRGASSAFDQGQHPGVSRGVYLVDREGTPYGRAIRYWTWAKRMAKEVLGREANPGEDYALSEVVHCGTKSEQGVTEARPLCTRRYLRRLLALSPAAVVVVIGTQARASFSEDLDIALAVGELRGPADVLGRERCVVALPHPNAFHRRWGLVPSLGEEATSRLLAFVR
jgi:hypothetical protein